MNEVDFIINVWEGTYRAALAPGYIKKIVNDNMFPFRRTIVLINNITNLSEARLLVEKLQKSGEIDVYAFVCDHLPHALSVAGLTKKDLGSIGYYSDWAFVAISLPESAPWICHWDAEAHLNEPINWISPSLDLMQEDSRIAVANPAWGKKGLDQETLFTKADFSLGYGFSDQVFLIRLSEFARPIYRNFVPASLRYPFAHVTPIFEQRVDSYMRAHRRLRATCRAAQYLLPDNEGSSYPPLNVAIYLRKLAIKSTLFGMRFIPTNDPKWRICPNKYC